MGVVFVSLLLLLVAGVYFFVNPNAGISDIHTADLFAFICLIAIIAFILGLAVGARAIDAERRAAISRLMPPGQAPSTQGTLLPQLPRAFTERLRIKTNLVVVAIVLVVVLSMFFLYASFSNIPPPPPSVPNWTIGFTKTGSSSMSSRVPVAWGLSIPFPCNDCGVLNFSLNTSVGLTTEHFGLKVLTNAGNPIATSWIAILWSYNGTAPLAGYSYDPGTWSWVAASGYFLPLGGLQGCHLMLISTTSISGQGNTLEAFGTNGMAVNSGQVAL
jgi:hypothetical protein